LTEEAVVSKRLLVVTGVLAIGLITVAVAAGAGGSPIKSASKSVNVQSGKTKDVPIACPSGVRAIASGYDGALSGSMQEGTQGLLTVTSRLQGKGSTTGVIGATPEPARFKATVYCRSQRVIEVAKHGDIKPGKTQNLTAKCPTGQTAISGGFRGSLVMGNPASIAVASYRSSSSEWTVSFAANPGVADKLPATAYAYCAHGDPLKPRKAVTTLRGDPNEIKTKSLTASCRKGERVVSGGFRPALRATGSNGPVTVDFYRASSSSWKISSAVFAINAKIRAYAYCEPK
jgi:hypothetical protein